MLITAEQVISISFTHANTKTALIKDAYILAAQEDFIKPALGVDLYNLIVSEKESGTYTGLNQTLYETWILKALAFYVKLLILPDMNVNTTNAGLVGNNTEFSSQVESQKRAELAQATRQMADVFIKGAMNYISENYASFNTYYSDSTPTKTKTTGGFIV